MAIGFACIETTSIILLGRNAIAAKLKLENSTDNFKPIITTIFHRFTLMKNKTFLLYLQLLLFTILLNKQNSKRLEKVNVRGNRRILNLLPKI